MAKTRHILKRARAIRNIRTVTKAMQSVAAARFKEIYDRITEFTPFATHLLDMVGDLVSRSQVAEADHPLLAAPPDLRHDVLLVLTSNRGLCGSFNSGVLQLALQRLQQLRQADYEVELHVVGARGVRYLRFLGLRVDKVHDDLPDVPDYPEAAILADRMMASFLDGRISGLEIAYTQFVSSGQQHAAVVPLLPLGDLPTRGDADAEPELRLPYDFLPEPRQILLRLLPATVRIKLFQCLLDSAAAEQFMRRTAMQAATDNADDVLHDLKILANRLRQMQITTELSEIMGGRVGLDDKR